MAWPYPAPSPVATGEGAGVRALEARAGLSRRARCTGYFGSWTTTDFQLPSSNSTFSVQVPVENAVADVAPGFM